MIEIMPLSAFDDNYIWLIKDHQSKHCAAVDPGDAKPVLTWLADNPQWQLTDILITHHHADHIGGIDQLTQVTSAVVFSPDNPSIKYKDHVLQEGQKLNILSLQCQIIAVPGHTLDHIAYYFPSQNETPAFLFSGDTLFAAGCGRVFEGTMEQMYLSLQKFMALPKETRVYCAHEYTLSNLRFAAAIEPDNTAIADFNNQCIELRKNNTPTIPTTLALEQQINPFLRCTIPAVIKSAVHFKKCADNSETAVFSALRELKNIF